LGIPYDVLKVDMKVWIGHFFDEDIDYKLMKDLQGLGINICNGLVSGFTRRKFNLNHKCFHHKRNLGNYYKYQNKSKKTYEKMHLL
jgi:hypothetical protein